MREDWESFKLKEVCEIRPPKRETKEILSEDDLVSFVPMSHLNEERKDFHEEEAKLLKNVYKGYTYFKDKDVLLAKITPCFENGKMGIAKGLTNGVGFGSSEFIVYRPDSRLVSEYLFYFLLLPKFRAEGEKMMGGAVGHQRIPKEFYEDYKIPIPPLPEQKRIVAMLDEAFEAIDQAKANIEQNIENAEELFQSKLNEIFSQRGEGWDEKTIDEITNVINGYAFKSNNFSPENSVKAIKITNVGVQEFVEDTENNLPKDFLDTYNKAKVSRGDIVIALTRTIISSGLKVARVPESYDGALVNQRVAALSPIKEIINPTYLYYFLSTDIVSNYVLSNVNTLMQPNLSIRDLRKLKVPVCSISKQKEITFIIDSLWDNVSRIIEAYQSKINNISELKKSILQKAFSGELTAGEPGFLGLEDEQEVLDDNMNMVGEPGVEYEVE